MYLGGQPGSPLQVVIVYNIMCPGIVLYTTWLAFNYTLTLCIYMHRHSRNNNNNNTGTPRCSIKSQGFTKDQERDKTPRVTEG